MEPFGFFSAFSATWSFESRAHADDRLITRTVGYGFDNCGKNAYDLFEKRGYSHAFVSLSKKLRARVQRFFIPCSIQCRRCGNVEITLFAIFTFLRAPSFPFLFLLKRGAAALAGL